MHKADKHMVSVAVALHTTAVLQRFTIAKADGLSDAYCVLYAVADGLKTAGVIDDAQEWSNAVRETVAELSK